MTQGDIPAYDEWPWEAMIDAFRALGGVAENIEPGEHGLYAINPSEPVLVRVPPDLLIRVDDIAVVNGRIVLDESAEVTDPARLFFDRYANGLGLRVARMAEIISFVKALALLPANVREVMANDLRFGPLLHGNPDEGIRSDFLRARKAIWHTGRVVAPVIELSRYDPGGLRPERGMNLQIQGYVKKEILVRFAPQDAYSAFRLFGRAVPEATAYSLGTTANFRQFQINIGRQLLEGTKRGKDRLPNISRDGQKISLSHLQLGHRKAPAQPRSVFRALLTEAGIENPDEAFDRIVRSNSLGFIKLLQCLEPHEGELISTLRTMARYQLEALYHCVGTRGIAPAQSD